MELDRRQLLASSGLYIAVRGTGARFVAGGAPTTLDAVLAAHADTLPERAGSGASHYPMAAEALEALGAPDAIEEAWVRGAAGYAGELPRAAPIEGWRGALGDPARYGDWLDLFRAELARGSWREVLAEWTPRLAPGLSAALFHGAIRSAHAARALEREETDARNGELAAGLAYWASRYVELPAQPLDVPADERDLRDVLTSLESPWLEQRSDVAFDDVMERIASTPLAPRVPLEANDASPGRELTAIVREAATAFLEMLVAERQRIWLLHTVTGPAAVALLLPYVDDACAHALVAHSRQAVIAMYAAYGEPYSPRAHLRAEPGEWPDLVARAVATRSVHTIKLVEALTRFDEQDDLLCRSVAAQWLEWK